MEHRTKGIILRTRLLTESSLIVHWLTPDAGRVSTVAKGARRPKSPFSGKLDLFFTAEFTFIRSRRSDLHTLREASLLDNRVALRQDIVGLQRACYGTAFLEQVTEPDTPLPGIFELFQGFIDEVCRRPAAPEVTLAFEIKMLDELGLRPVLETAALSEGARKIAGHLSADRWSDLQPLKPTAAQLRELRHFLQSCLLQHFGRVPRGRDAAVA
ncbi:MAG TPA: DNA repair protein RecO [Verrucomicrobiae bacterium]|nr:DNA repair protein RecO [Verrucomicrobiae bacterium]